ncbi:Malate (citrate)/Na+ symporter [Candidatus Phytoplasma mali]|uniref:Malate (Citrate)/Na+ symporter n=1 Tax=Phytoplasma mali (strain AT) TaxID=482235 RepID=B3R042_PHYMT|nr:2-hydroxycarboxylate transporter family protein [Candidatus Phytoplasma mali]CAP18206.1 Malate (citrate)/Na+ symporter [Candidatus Phytoplasma mali]CAP18666.1 Malate (citrate)/Na+ symporter [Candidatus Phytoplasma mali]
MKEANIIKNKNNKYEIFSLKSLFFLGLMFICVLNVYMFKQNTASYYQQLFTPLLLCMVLGIFLHFVGNMIPFLNKFGLSFLLCALVPSYLVYQKVISPKLVEKFHEDFFNKGINFPHFFILLVIAGSIFSIDNKLLKKSMKKFLPLTLISVTVAFLLVGGIGHLLHFSVPKGFISKGSFLDAIFYVFVPITNGGVNFGVNGLTNGLYGRVSSKINNFELRAFLIAPLILTRILAIVFTSLLCNYLNKTKLNGQGQLEYIKNKNKSDLTNKNKKLFELSDIRTGLLIAIAFYMLGRVLSFVFFKNNDFVLVFMIILLFIFKLFNLMPISFQGNLIQTGKFMTTNFAAPMLVGFSLTTNWKILLAALTASKIILLVLTSLLTVTLISLLLAKKFGFYALEAALTAGLGSHSVGDSPEFGGIITISKKLDLLPLMNITTRIIGPMIFFISSLSFQYFYTS